MACHIYSAAPGGPRGQGGLTPEQVASAENGFWACRDHGTLIDTNAGTGFPAAKLIRWRELAEARIRRARSGQSVPACWIECVRIVENPPHLFPPGETLELSHITIVSGPNGSGKTALCEWLGVAIDDGLLKRLRGTDFAVELIVHSPEPETVGIRNCDGQKSLSLNGSTVPVNPVPMVVQYMDRGPWRRAPREDEEGTSDVAYLAQWLRVAPAEVRSLIRHVDYNPNSLVRSITVDDDDCVDVGMSHSVHGPFSLQGLSSTEELMVVLSLAMVRVATCAPRCPCLFLIDSVMQTFDPPNVRAVLTELAKLSQVQTVIMLPDLLDLRVRWGGWSTVEIVRRDKKSFLQSR
jgi:ABC-type Mn2+/Zn2+ transport system ATPase subunit